jgi:hypothetical protein
MKTNGFMASQRLPCHSERSEESGTEATAHPNPVNPVEKTISAF